jgi:hypothetical protein
MQRRFLRLEQLIWLPQERSLAISHLDKGKTFVVK